MLGKSKCWLTRGPIAVALLLAPFGCASSDGPPNTTDRTPRATAPGVDLTRAALPLSDIEPKVSEPTRPETIQPLSGRAERQIVNARRLMNQERFTEAAIELERALRYDPKHPDIHITLATLHWDAGNFERAKTHALRALEGNPDQAAGHYLTARCAIRDRDPAAAIASLRTALLCDDFGEDVEVASLVHVHLAQQLAAEGYIDAALSQYEAFERSTGGLNAASVRPELAAWLGADRARIAEAKADLHERLGRFSDAADALQPVAAKRSGDAVLQRRYARLLLDARRHDEALAAARTLPLNADDTIELLFDIYSELDQRDSIIHDLRAYAREQPDDPQPVMALADMLERLGRETEARTALEQFLEEHERAHAIRLRYVRLLFDTAQWDEGLRACAEGIRRSADRAPDYTGLVAKLASDADAVTAALAPEPSGMAATEAFVRGVLATAADKPEPAERYLRECFAQDPGFIPGRLALARLYASSYDYPEALEVAGRKDQGAPQHAQLEFLLGQIHERLDDIDAAELHLKAAVQLDRADTSAMLALAKLYQRSGRRLQAQRQYQVLLDKDPNHEAARELLAYTYLEEGKRDVAAQQFEELARRSQSATTRARCAAILEQALQPAPDVGAYRAALIDAVEQHGGDASTWLSIAESYRDPTTGFRQLGVEAAKPREAYRKALAFDPDNDQATLGVIQTSHPLLDFEEAARQFETLLKRRPNRHSWRLGSRRAGLIDYYWWTQNYDAALALTRAAMARKDLNDVWRTRFRAAMAETLRLSRRTKEAMKLIQDWAKPELSSAMWRGLARSALSDGLAPIATPDGAVEKTLQRWSDALKIEAAPWARVLADEYTRRGEPARAVPIWQTLRAATPDNLDITMSLINALRAAGRYDRASQHVLDMLAEDPENDDALALLSTILADAQRVDDALELIRNRLLHTFDRERFQTRMVVALAGAERYDDGIELVEALIDEAMGVLADSHAGGAGVRRDELRPAVLARTPNEPFTLEGLQERIALLRRQLVQLLLAAKEYRTAESQLNDWLESTRNPAMRFVYLGRLATCYLLQGKAAKATETQERALLLRPDDVSLNNDVAYAWIDRGIRLDEADRMIRYALSRNPTQVAYLDTFGWLLYKKGEFAEAKKWMLRAVRAQEEPDAVIHDHLGDCCWRAGAKDEAVEHWTAAVAALEAQGELDFQTDDRRRVREVTPAKIEAANSGQDPPLAPLAQVPSDDTETAAAD
jgi:tetratricopeptide (TPR) repeat protein